MGTVLVGDPLASGDVAAQINDAHRLATTAIETAVEHARRCGELLAAQKERLPHGRFGPWVRAHCEFSERTARLYMQAARNGNAFPFSSLRMAIKGRDEPAKPRPRRTPLSSVVDRIRRLKARRVDPVRALADALFAECPDLAVRLTKELAAAADRAAARLSERNCVNAPSPRPRKLKPPPDRLHKLNVLVDHHNEQGRFHAAIDVTPEQYDALGRSLDHRDGKPHYRGHLVRIFDDQPRPQTEPIEETA